MYSPLTNKTKAKSSHALLISKKLLIQFGIFLYTFMECGVGGKHATL
jgi:hypothetical protein